MLAAPLLHLVVYASPERRDSVHDPTKCESSGIVKLRTLSFIVRKTSGRNLARHSSAQHRQKVSGACHTRERAAHTKSPALPPVALDGQCIGTRHLFRSEPGVSRLLEAVLNNLLIHQKRLNEARVMRILAPPNNSQL